MLSRLAARGPHPRGRTREGLRRGGAGGLASRCAAVATLRGRGGFRGGDMSAPTPILIDCDPGHDDALAILFALASPEVDLLGVTTTYGNQTVDKTTGNALRVLELAGRPDVPVAAGADGPLARDVFVASYVHGETGLDGTELPAPTAEPVEQDAVDFLAERIAPGVALVPTGPLTNTARLLERGVQPDRIVL